MCHEARVNPVILHVGHGDIVGNWATKLADARTIGVKWVVLSSFPGDMYTVEGIRLGAQQLNEAGAAARQLGLGMLHHNHDTEFRVVDGIRLSDILFGETDPRLVDFELDIGWADRAGMDARQLFADHPDRFPVLHVKDHDGAGRLGRRRARRHRLRPHLRAGAPRGREVLAGGARRPAGAAGHRAQQLRTPCRHLGSNPCHRPVAGVGRRNDSRTLGERFSTASAAAGGAALAGVPAVGRRRWATTGRRCPSSRTRSCVRSCARWTRGASRQIVRKLVSFGTRHTLSTQDDPTRGIGAARDWIFAELQRYAAASDGRMTVELQSYIQPPAARIPVPTRITNVIATLRGSVTPERVYVVSGHYDSRVTDVMNATATRPGANDDASGVAVSWSWPGSWRSAPEVDARVRRGRRRGAGPLRRDGTWPRSTRPPARTCRPCSPTTSWAAAGRRRHPRPAHGPAVRRGRARPRRPRRRPTPAARSAARTTRRPASSPASSARWRTTATPAWTCG